MPRHYGLRLKEERRKDSSILSIFCNKAAVSIAILWSHYWQTRSCG